LIHICSPSSRRKCLITCLATHSLMCLTIIDAHTGKLDRHLATDVPPMAYVHLRPSISHGTAIALAKSEGHTLRKGRNVRKCNKHILDALDLACRLTILADEGETDAQDDSCVVLYGVIRDCAYKIRKLAEQERDAHIARGIWDSNSS